MNIEIVLEDIVVREKTDTFPNSVYKLYTKNPGDLTAGGIIAALKLIHAGNLGIQEGKKYQLIIKEINYKNDKSIEQELKDWKQKFIKAFDAELSLGDAITVIEWIEENILTPHLLHSDKNVDEM